MIDLFNDDISDSVYAFFVQHGLNEVSSLNLRAIREKLLCVRTMEIPRMAPFLEPFRIDLPVEPTDPENLEQAEKLRTNILHMMERETETVRDLIQGTTQIKQSARKNIIAHYDGSREALKELAVGLMHRLLVNFQPGIKRLIENLLMIYHLKAEPRLLSDIAGCAAGSFQAMHCLLGPMIIISFRDWLVRHFSNEIKLKIEKDLGIVIDSAALEGSDMFQLMEMMKEEARHGRDLLQVRDHLFKVTESELMLEEGNSITIETLPVKAAQPMVFLKGFYREYRVVLESFSDIEEGKIGLYAGIIRPGDRTNVLSKVVIKHGAFRSDACGEEPLNSLAISILNYMVRMDEKAIGGVRKTVNYLERIYHELFEPTRELKKAASLADSMSGRDGVAHLDFVPEKNASLFFRALAGGDCSIDLDLHVTHPRSAFYKVMQGSEWIGYVTLLDVCDRVGRRAMLMDVMNLRKNIQVDYLDLFDLFADAIRRMTEPMGYCYVLISPDCMSISNNEIIRVPVFRHYGMGAGKRVQGFRLDPFEKTFHTSGIDEFIAVRDFSSHGQLLMFEEC